MPRVSDVEVYRLLIMAQQPGPGAAGLHDDDSGRPDLVRVAATMTSAGPGLSVVVVVFDGDGAAPGPYRFEPATRCLVAIPAGDWCGVLRRRHPHASAVLIVAGDVDRACADAGLPGYGQLLVRAGAAIEAGSVAAAEAGFVARIAHTTDSAVNRALAGPDTPLSSIALLRPRPGSGQ